MSLKTKEMPFEVFGRISISGIIDGRPILRTFEPNASHEMLLSLRNPLDHMLELTLHWDVGRDVIDRLLGSSFSESLSVESLSFSYISHMNET